MHVYVYIYIHIYMHRYVSDIKRICPVRIAYQPTMSLMWFCPLLWPSQLKTPKKPMIVAAYENCTYLKVAFWVTQWFLTDLYASTRQSIHDEHMHNLHGHE